MRRIIEQALVDAAELTGMFAEALIFGIPFAIHEIGTAMRPYAYELALLGGLLWILFW